MELLDITNREKSLGDEMREYAQYADKAIAHQEPIYNKYYTITDLQGKNELVLSRDDNWEMTKGRLADKVYISGDAVDKFTKYENIQDKLDKRFSGCITLEKIVDAFIEFYDQQERDEPLAECMLIVNDNVRKYEQWEKAEKQGRLIELPCETVWYIVDRNNMKYADIMSKHITDLAIYEIEGIDKDGYYYSTKEAAEQVLAKIKERCKNG